MNFTWNYKDRLGIARLWIVLAIALLMAGGGGVVAARYIVQDGAAEEQEEAEPEKEEAEKDDDFSYVRFGSVVVNLAEGRLTRYLKVKIALKLPKESAPKVKKIIESGRKSVYTNWLITYLSGLRLQQVKGSDAIRRLRGKIKVGFNEILRKEQDIQIKAVLFEEFNVQ